MCENKTKYNFLIVNHSKVGFIWNWKNVLFLIVIGMEFSKSFQARPLKARLFQRHCDELWAEHNNLLFYCNARWLSKGTVLLHVYEMKSEIFIFLKEKKYALATTLEDEVFLTQLVYLCDMFAKLNQLNISLQGKDAHLLQLHEKITAFKRKPQLWKTDLLMNNKQCDSFPLVHRATSSLLTLNFFSILRINAYIFVHFEQGTWFQDNFLVNLEICKFWLHYGASIGKFSKGAVNKKSLGTTVIQQTAQLFKILSLCKSLL